MANRNKKKAAGDYYPGYSDDATADTLGGIREKTSPIVNAELKKLESKIMSYYF